MTTRELPEGRYGAATRPTPRWVHPLLLVLVVLTGVGAAVVGYRNLAAAPIEGQLLGFRLLEGNAVQVRIEVTRGEDSAPGVCIVRARSRDGEETGRREVYVPPAVGPATDTVVLTTVVRTSRPPVAADVYGCSLEVPAYLRGPAPGAGG